MTEQEIIKLGNVVFDNRDISPSQLGITSRQINHWIKKKLVPFVENQQPIDNGSSSDINISKTNKETKNKWVRLNLAQAVWVCMIKELLAYGVTVPSIEKLASDIWQKPRKKKYADKIFKEHIKYNKHRLSSETIDVLKQNLQDELLMEHYFRTIINPFTEMIKSAIIKERFPHSMLYVPATNRHEFLTEGNGIIFELGSVYLKHPMISLPIVPILSKVLAVDLGNTKKELSYLTAIEKQIRDIVVFKKPKEVVIAYEDDHIKPITITEDHKTREQLSKYILESKIAIGSKLLIDIRSQGNYKLTLIKK